MFRLLGHEGSVLALMVVPEKGWLVSSSSEFLTLLLATLADDEVPVIFECVLPSTTRVSVDTQIWTTAALQPVYIIHPCDRTSGDIYCLAWDDRRGGTLYFGVSLAEALLEVLAD